jgi:hypothetical protein
MTNQRPTRSATVKGAAMAAPLCTTEPGHIISFGEDFPTFPGCRAVFLAGPLSAEGLDHVHTSVDAVRVINVVPITDAEREWGRTLPPVDFARSLMEHVDVFAERPR